jgi:hypothetical protein
MTDDGNLRGRPILRDIEQRDDGGRWKVHVAERDAKFKTGLRLMILCQERDRAIGGQDSEERAFRTWQVIAS